MQQFQWLVVLLVAAFVSLLVVPFYMFSATELAPVEDQSGIFLIIESPSDASLEYTTSYMDDVVDRVEENVPGLLYMWQVLNPAGGFAGCPASLLRC